MYGTSGTLQEDNLPPRSNLSIVSPSVIVIAKAMWRTSSSDAFPHASSPCRKMVLTRPNREYMINFEGDFLVRAVTTEKP